MTILTYILVVLSLGFSLPKPPGILGALLDYHLFGGKERKQKEIRKWKILDEIEKELAKEGKTLHDEFKLANKGKSKYFKKS